MIECLKARRDCPAQDREVLAEGRRGPGVAGAHRKAGARFRGKEILGGRAVFDEPSCGKMGEAIGTGIESLHIDHNLEVNVHVARPRVLLNPLSPKQLSEVLGDHWLEDLVERFAPAFLCGQVDLVGRGEGHYFRPPEISGKVYRPNTKG